MITYIRMQARRLAESRLFEPLTETDNLIGELCLACGVEFAVGDRVVLVPLGPGGDEDQRNRFTQRGFFTAVAVTIHGECAGGLALHPERDPSGVDAQGPA